MKFVTITEIHAGRLVVSDDSQVKPGMTAAYPYEPKDSNGAEHLAVPILVRFVDDRHPQKNSLIVDGELHRVKPGWLLRLGGSE